MSNLKQLIQDDLNVFINSNEFAEAHVIDGLSVNIIIDNDRLKERSRKEYENIAVGELLYYVKSADMQTRPIPGSTQIFDNKLMYVFDSREDQGMYEVILTQNRGE